MWQWIKDHRKGLITYVITIGVLIYIYGCESKVRSMLDNRRLINRQELQLELDQFMGLVQVRLADLDKQDQFRALILQNALILVQGQPFNPLGLLTGIGAIYGVAQATSNITKTIKTTRAKRKVNNG